MLNKTVLLLLVAFLAACQTKTPNNYIQFVDQNIGTSVSTTPTTDGKQQVNPVGGQTIIGVSAPFGMTQ